MIAAMALKQSSNGRIDVGSLLATSLTCFNLILLPLIIDESSSQTYRECVSTNSMTRFIGGLHLDY